MELQHDGIWKFKCGICEELFESKNKVTSHRMSVHHAPKVVPEKAPKKDPTPKICDICGKTVQSLTYHKKSYHVNDKIPCPHCGKTFKSQQSVYHHIGKRFRLLTLGILGQLRLGLLTF